MFSTANFMDVFGPRQSNNNNNMSFPCFVDLGPQNGHGPFGFAPRYHCQPRQPTREDLNNACAPLVDLLQQVFEPKGDDERSQQNKPSDPKKQKCGQGKQSCSRQSGKENPCHGNEEKMRKSCGRGEKADCCKQRSNDNKSMPPHVTSLQDIMKNVMSGIKDLRTQAASNANAKWQQKVDCRNFESRNIKIKIDEDQLLLKAFKKVESGNEVRTMSMSKSVALPAGIDKTKIKCKLTPVGILIIEAPFIVAEEDKATGSDFVREVMTMFPCLDQLMQNMNVDRTSASDESQEHESAASNDKEGGENENEKSDEKREEGESTASNENQNCEQSTTQLAETKEVVQTNTSQKGSLEIPTSKKDEGHIPEDDEEICETLMAVTHQDASTEPPSEQTEDIQTNDPVVTFPEDSATEEPVSVDVEGDGASVSSEDSFVLLSQLENESRKNYIGKDNATPHEESVDDNDDKVEETDVNTEDAGNRENIENNISNRNATENSDEDVIFRLEMPSYNPECMKVTFDSNKKQLNISASKADSHTAGMTSPPGTITKTVTIDDDVDVNGLQCFFKDGSLTVTAPRKTSIRNIPIHG